MINNEVILLEMIIYLVVLHIFKTLIGMKQLKILIGMIQPSCIVRILLGTKEVIKKSLMNNSKNVEIEARGIGSEFCRQIIKYNYDFMFTKIIYMIFNKN